MACTFYIDPPPPCPVKSDLSLVQPYFSGAQLVWSFHEDQIAVTTSRKRIYLVSANPQNIVQSYQTVPNQGWNISWSPDGERIVFSERGQDTELIMTAFEISTGVLTKIPLNSLDQKFRNNTIVHYLLANDHSQLLLTRRRDPLLLGRTQYDFFLVDLLSNPPNSRLVATHDAVVAAWSPDLTTILLSSQHDVKGKFNPDAGYKLVAIDVSSGDKRQFTTARGCQQDPSWSQDNTQVAYSSSQDNNWDIFVTSLTDGTIENITNTPDQDEFQPDWSPDGQYIAYVAFNSYAGTGTQDIFVYNIAKGYSINLTNGSGRVDTPVWSPSGNHIAFMAFDSSEGKWHLEIIKPDGTGRTRLAPLP